MLDQYKNSWAFLHTMYGTSVVNNQCVIGPLKGTKNFTKIKKNLIWKHILVRYSYVFLIVMILIYLLCLPITITTPPPTTNNN